jgi:hypothetical protein
MFGFLSSNLMKALHIHSYSQDYGFLVYFGFIPVENNWSRFPIVIISKNTKA